MAIEPAEMEREMNERGVAPDLVRGDITTGSKSERLNAELIESPIFDKGGKGEAELPQNPALIVWRVGSGQHKDLALLDQIALACLDTDDWAARRWLRLAPRYLGRMTQGLRLLPASREFAARLEEHLVGRAARGEITFPYDICCYVRGGLNFSNSFDPQKS